MAAPAPSSIWLNAFPAALITSPFTSFGFLIHLVFDAKPPPNQASDKTITPASLIIFLISFIIGDLLNFNACLWFLTVPGIKVDTGAKILSNSTDEKITEGLEGLRERLKEYYKLGARFTKWRAVYVISEKYPSKIAIYSNAHALAKYAALVQEARMVPIVEPEVLMDGDHNAEECFKKTSEVIKKCFEELIVNKVQLNGIILKPNMVLPGTNSDQKIDNEEIAEITIKCLRESVPKEVPGIAFLSGGQSESDATKNLNLINVHNNTNFIMTYSYGRALQQSALKFWSKNLENIEETQKIFNHRANMNSLAAQGKWTEEIEKI